MGRQRNRKGGGGSGALKSGTKRERSEEGAADGAAESKAAAIDRNVWRTDIRDPSTLSNPLFEKYYQQQVFFNKEAAEVSGWLGRVASAPRPGEERWVQDWGVFFSSLKMPLPSAIRINSNHPDRHLVRDMLFKELEAIGLSMVKESGGVAAAVIQQQQADVSTTGSSASQEVYTLQYVPEGLAFQMDLSKGELKRDGQFKRVKKIIAALNEGGYLTRQEAVSMIPPLMLDVRPGMRVLDMCAAPGSKTSQLLEAVIKGGYESAPAAAEPKDGELALDSFVTPLMRANPAKGGCIVANDVNIARIDVLHHQTGRAAHSHPNLIVTNNDATNFPLFPVPEEEGGGSPKYDRVLCDVMCSGDGTLRKSIDLWARWNPLQGADLHCSQLKTLLRGMSLVKAGGVVVYSTCSMNPIEDEAVVAEALLTAGGAFELIDKFNAAAGSLVPELLQGLKYSPGVTDWTLSNRDATRMYSSYADAFSHRRDELQGRGFNYRPSMFPPHKQAYPEGHKTKYPDDREVDTYSIVNDDNYKSDPLNLNRCIRVLPHQQNTGGFFIAAFRCLKDYDHEEQRRQIKERRQAAYQERTGVVGDGAASLEKVHQKVAAQAADARTKRDPLYNPISEEMRGCVQSVLPPLTPTQGVDCILPLGNLFIRRGQGLDNEVADDEDADKTGSRNVKIFLATKEASECLIDFPRGMIVKQIGAKVLESYVKYHPEKLRVWPETLDTLMPYFAGCSAAATIAAQEHGAIPSKTYLLQCDPSWLLDLVAAQAVKISSGAVQSGKGRVNIVELIQHCTPLSVVERANGARVGIPQTPFKDAQDCLARLPPKSFVLVVPLGGKGCLRDPSLPNTLAGFHPLHVSCEMDDGNVTASLKLAPHQLSLLQLYVTGDNTAVVGEKASDAYEAIATGNIAAEAPDTA